MTKKIPLRSAVIATALACALLVPGAFGNVSASATSHFSTTVSAASSPVTLDEWKAYNQAQPEYHKLLTRLASPPR